MRRLLLGLVLALGLVGAGNASATITMTQHFPTVYGHDGTGGLETDYTVHNTSSTQIYMINAASFIRIETSSPPGAGYRNRLEADWDSGIAVQGDIHGTGYGTLAYAFTPSDCPFGGFHQFYPVVWWQSRVWVPQLGQWTTWTTLVYNTNGNFIYGQVCL